MAIRKLTYDDLDGVATKLATLKPPVFTSAHYLARLLDLTTEFFFIDDNDGSFCRISIDHERKMVTIIWLVGNNLLKLLKTIGLEVAKNSDLLDYSVFSEIYSPDTINGARNIALSYKTLFPNATIQSSNQGKYVIITLPTFREAVEIGKLWP